MTRGYREEFFPSRSRSAGEVERLLIPGLNNRKLGSHWAKVWPGMPIYTLSLVERRTCPACTVRDECMGKGQPYTLRLKPDRHLITRLRNEIANLASIHDRGFSVRLHALGDFYSVPYARFWIGQVREHQSLHVFGFTAHDRESEIGIMLERESRKWDHFRLRFSGGRGERTSTVMIDPPAGRQTAGITCPYEVGSHRVRSCGECGFCLSSRKPVVFNLH